MHLLQRMCMYTSECLKQLGGSNWSNCMFPCQRKLVKLWSTCPFRTCHMLSGALDVVKRAIENSSTQGRGPKQAIWTSQVIHLRHSEDQDTKSFSVKNKARLWARWAWAGAVHLNGWTKWEHSRCPSKQRTSYNMPYLPHDAASTVSLHFCNENTKNTKNSNLQIASALECCAKGQAADHASVWEMWIPQTLEELEDPSKCSNTAWFQVIPSW